MRKNLFALISLISTQSLLEVDDNNNNDSQQVNHMQPRNLQITSLVPVWVLGGYVFGEVTLAIFLIGIKMHHALIHSEASLYRSSMRISVLQI